MDTIGHYSVPITRRVGSNESEIPEPYRARTHLNHQVRCGLFAGDNLVQVTWSGPDQALLRFRRGDNSGLTLVGTIPSGGGCVPAHSASQPSATRIFAGSHSTRPRPRWAPTGEPSPSPGWGPSAPKGGGVDAHHRDHFLAHREACGHRQLQAIRLGFSADHPRRCVSDNRHMGRGCHPQHLRRGWGGHTGANRHQWQDFSVRVPRPIRPSNPSHKNQPGGPQPGTGSTNHNHLTRVGGCK